MPAAVYTVTQSFQPDLGAELTDAKAGSGYNDAGTSTIYRVLPGLFRGREPCNSTHRTRGIFCRRGFFNPRAATPRSSIRYRPLFDRRSTSRIRTGLARRHDDPL